MNTRTTSTTPARLLVALATFIALVLQPNVAAGGENCRWVGTRLVCDIDDPGEPVDPVPTPEPEEPVPPSPYETIYIRAEGPCLEGPDYGVFIVETRLRATGELIRSWSGCLPVDVTPVPPPPPPPPPTLDEFVFQIEDLLELESSVNPPPEGIGGVSQLETWFWCDDSGDVTIDLTLNGWRVTATASVTELTWTIEGPDGELTRTATDCGSQPEIDSDGSSAAARWTPNEAGDYTITLTAEWGGEWTRSFGTFSETLDLGTVSVGNPGVDYTVVEIQTVGVPTP